MRPRGRTPAEMRAWLDELFITPESSARNIARLTKVFPNAALDRDAGHRIFSRVGPTGEFQEVRVETGTGTIAEVRMSRGGQLVQRIQYEYTRGAGGIIVRTGIRIERQPPDGRGTPMVLKETLRNVRLEKRGTI